MAALAVAYGRAPRTARRAWCEETLTIAPPVANARKRRTAVAHPTTVGFRFRAIASSTSRVEAEWIVAWRNTAALLTHPVNVPAACARSAACKEGVRDSDREIVHHLRPGHNHQILHRTSTAVRLANMGIQPQLARVHPAALSRVE